MVEPPQILRFQDQETQKEALEDGDLEVFVPMAEARELRKMLHARLDSLP